MYKHFYTYPRQRSEKLITMKSQIEDFPPKKKKQPKLHTKLK